MDISPAKWIWLPAGRTLPCTFALFRKEFTLVDVPDVCEGRIGADSRYLLFVNGQRVQWGPAPHDPRHAELDPFDLAPFLQAGLNAVSAVALFYGHPEGTWPFGQPGFALTCPTLGLHSDESWKCLVDPVHEPGGPPRWYLRALQEKADLRREDLLWKEPGFDDSRWLAARPTGAPPTMSSASGRHGVYHQDWFLTGPNSSSLSPRLIPLMKEEVVPAVLAASHRVRWSQSPDLAYDFRMEGIMELQPASLDPELAAWDPQEGLLFTFALDKGRLGFPIVELEAGEGTVVHLTVQESCPRPDPGWLETTFHSWSRFVCREGTNRFEAFDYEAASLIQVHLHGGAGQASRLKVSLRSRELPFPREAAPQVSDPVVQKVLDACIQTMKLSCQDISVDGMARERQQYSGDCGHQHRCIRLGFGETRLTERYLRTYARGQLSDGVFLDSWPAADRLQRIWQREMGLTTWGAIYDHSVGFVLDHWLYYWETGKLEAAKEAWPSLLRFARSLPQRLRDGLVEVVETGDRVVWMDHDAYRRQEEKELAASLYTSGMLTHGLAPLARALQDIQAAEWAAALGGEILKAARARWGGKQWRCAEDGWIDDRSLAMALLFDQSPGGSDEWEDEALRLLAVLPEGVGRSYPANVIWNHWALASRGWAEPCVDDLRTRWSQIISIDQNGTLQEAWDAAPGSLHIMSHCAAAPLATVYDALMGASCLAPGWKRYVVRPRLGGLDSWSSEIHLPIGTLAIEASSQVVKVQAPSDGEGELWIGTRKWTLKGGLPLEVEWGPDDPSGIPGFGGRTGPFPPTILMG